MALALAGSLGTAVWASATQSAYSVEAPKRILLQHLFRQVRLPGVEATTKHLSLQRGCPVEIDLLTSRAPVAYLYLLYAGQKKTMEGVE